MTSPVQRRSSKCRWQLSLRTMLVLMALVGVGLAIFRWPWEETKSWERQAIGVGTTWVIRNEHRQTYRRNWRFAPVKHGAEQFLIDGQLRHEAHYYESELHGQRREFDRQGRTLAEATYRAGELQGPFRVGTGNAWIWQGEYDRGVWHGLWRGIVHRQGFAVPPDGLQKLFYPDESSFKENAIYFLPQEPVEVVANWKHGFRHGVWTWKSLDGETLYTAEYDRGNLVRWDGEPVVEQFLKWLAGPEVNDGELMRLLTDDSLAYSSAYFMKGAKRKAYFSEKSSTHYCIIHGERFAYGGWHLPFMCDSLAAELCELAIWNGCAFDYRYGGLWLVPLRTRSRRLSIPPAPVRSRSSPALRRIGIGTP